jgi:hypothetical protein
LPGAGKKGDAVMWKLFWFVYRRLLSLRMWMLRRRYEAWLREEFERDRAARCRFCDVEPERCGRKHEGTCGCDCHSSPTMLEPEESSRARTPERAPDYLNWN